MDLDLLISKYSKDLMEMKSKWSQWGIEVEEKVEDVKENDKDMLEAASENASSKSSTDATEENALNEAIAASLDIEEKPNAAQDVDSTQEMSEENSIGGDEETSTNERENAESEEEVTGDVAGFSARVFTGEDAYPVENAKVLIYKDKKLFHFLLTDENGNTPRVEIAAAPSENALIPNSENQQIDYLAEVFADGFTPQRDLLVSAVGGTDILLPVQLIPISERND